MTLNTESRVGQIATSMTDHPPLLTAALIRRYDQPGPRYTSYPTAVELDTKIDPEVYDRHLRRASAEPDQPLSLYLHLPFCAERCHYCGCNVVITRKRDVAARYLDGLEKEIRAAAQALGKRRRLRQMHWGGGTPTYLSSDELRWLSAVVRQDFELEPDAEIAIEIDPRVTTIEQMETLRHLGFNRLSMGVQDFTLAVQKAVNRVQPFSQTQALVQAAHRLGFSSINIDLIYGLPLQSPKAFHQTLERVLELRPERVAVYSYAHMPWLKVQQRRIRQEDLPSPAVKLELLGQAIDAFCGAGYRSIGMDHFALPDDELGRALDDGSLWRNFMGYTVRQAPDLIGCGLSSISDVAGGLFQNENKLIRYQRAVDGGRWATHRGLVLSPDDHLRRYIITSLMCRFTVSVADVENRFSIDFGEIFARERKDLRAFVEDGFVEITDDAIRVVGEGRLFVRNVCMVFDAYLRQAADERRFSRTV